MPDGTHPTSRRAAPAASQPGSRVAESGPAESRKSARSDWRGDVAAEALAGLTGAAKTLPPKLFYDEAGCRLFDDITRLPEYYVTRTELALLHRIAPDLAAVAPAHVALVEYGACDETKASILLAALCSPAAYLPIDIAAPALRALQRRMQTTHPTLAVHPIAADFLDPLDLEVRLAEDGIKLPRMQPVLGFFPGSTIGNLEPAAATRLLGTMRATLTAVHRSKGAVHCVVGVDLRKDPALLIPAYDDRAGVTAAFNRNLLTRLNREAAANFDPEGFAHRAIWNDAESRVEMHLVSRAAQMVRVAGRIIRFAAGESIHTENSYKHSAAGFIALAQAAGWASARVWTDAEALFSVHLLTAEATAEA